MADIISNIMLTYLAEKKIDLENDVIKVALMSSSYTPNKDTNTFDNTYEISGTGYIAGGATLTGSTVTQDDSGDQAVWDADDTTWSELTATARYAILYDTTVSNIILVVFDFGEDKTSSAGPFTVRYNVSGIMDNAQG